MPLLFPLSRALPAFANAAKKEDHIYVLDAGHGGEDGGAVSGAGAKESDINLAITLKLNELIRFLGKKTILTRSSDISIYSDGAQTLREKKTSDLKNRVELVNKTKHAVLISIHQNSLPSVPSVHGAQVFYSAVEPSAQLAASIQNAMNIGINLQNQKEEKRIDPSIYLMKMSLRPAVLIECGFMSNAEEAEKLQSPDYQKKLAVAIAAGIMNKAEERLTE